MNLSRRTSCPSELPPWKTSEEWNEINRNITDLIRNNRSSLTDASAIAEAIREKLESLFPIMDELCATTCPSCREVCCSLARVWFDYSDLLFLHMVGAPLPPAQPVENISTNCRYLTPAGCELPRLSRPWLCTLFMCRPQEAGIRKKGKAFKLQFNACLDDIQKERKLLLKKIHPLYRSS